MTPNDGSDPAAITVAFNDCINDRDLAGLGALLTPDHEFVDAAGGSVAGADAVLEAWRGFFDAFPDYRNVFTEVEVGTDGLVVVIGHSVCPNEAALEGPAIWTARITSGRVREWRVHEDVPDVRQALAGR